MAIADELRFGVHQGRAERWNQERLPNSIPNKKNYGEDFHSTVAVLSSISLSNRTNRSNAVCFGVSSHPPGLGPH
jgi:hypothetical protein